jgi:hypothetical protein
MFVWDDFFADDDFYSLQISSAKKKIGAKFYLKSSQRRNQQQRIAMKLEQYPHLT